MGTAALMLVMGATTAFAQAASGAAPVNAAPPSDAAVAQSSAPVRPDSVRPFLVFAPTGESWFVAASRGKRMLLDIGRVDLEVRKDSAVAVAYRAAVTAATPVKVGTTFTLRAPWGTEEVRATGVDTWNGRIVLVLAGSAMMDSAAQGTAPVVASAYRQPPRGATVTPSAVQPSPPLAMTAGGIAPCVRPAITGAAADRLKVLRDSLEQVLRAMGPPLYERLARRVTASSSRVSGCFGNGRAILAVSLRAGAVEWSRERVVMVDAYGHATPLAVEDLRFKVHDLLHAVDADGDGVDDVAAVGRAFRAGGTTLLRYDEGRKKLVRVAAGFVWEDL
jgi:hypothetical protein